MRTGITLYIILFLLFSGCVSKKSIDVRWKSYEEGMEKAEKENKTMLVYFYTKNCMSCRLFEKYILSNETVKEKMKEFVCIKINVEENENLMEKYNVRDFPTVLFIKNEKEINRIEGYNGDAKSFLNEMEKAIE